MQKCPKVGAECCPVFWQTFYVPPHVQVRLVHLYMICFEKLLCLLLAHVVTLCIICWCIFYIIMFCVVFCYILFELF